MAVDIFINMGKTITGESSDKTQGPKGDIDVLIWSWGMYQPATMHGGGTGKPEFHNFEFTKFADSASTGLMYALANGTHIPECVLLVRTSGKGQLVYLNITMSEVIVSSVNLGGRDGEERFTEKVSLNFGKVKYAYSPQNSNGQLGAALEFDWDIAHNAAA